MSIWHWIIAVIGSKNEAGGWYGFWSGFAGSVQPTLLGTGGVLYWHHTCHVGRCWRPGRHPVDGTPYKACAKHHPAIDGPVTVKTLTDAHRRRL